MKEDSCYCDSGKTFRECCEPLLLGTATATDPMSLMRSRYSAFCTANVEYLIATLHSSRQSPPDRSDLMRTIRETDWMSLKVLSNSIQESNGTGIVEFVAFYCEKDQSSNRSNRTIANQLHEKSEFVREAGLWFYTQGQMLPPIKLGRNDRCWCGSGKKVKQCHG